MAKCEGEASSPALPRDLDVGGDMSPLPSMWPPARLPVVLVLLVLVRVLVVPTGPM